MILIAWAIAKRPACNQAGFAQVCNSFTLPCLVADIPCRGVNAIIGLGLLRRCPVTIDFEAKRLTFGSGELPGETIFFDPSASLVLVPLNLSGKRDRQIQQRGTVEESRVEGFCVDARSAAGGCITASVRGIPAQASPSARPPAAAPPRRCRTSGGGGGKRFRPPCRRRGMPREPSGGSRRNPLRP